MNVIKIAKINAQILESLPSFLQGGKKQFTSDQLRLLKYDNIPSGKYKTNTEIGIPSKRYFKKEVEKYCYMWREGGQFSTEKYNTEKS